MALTRIHLSSGATVDVSEPDFEQVVSTVLDYSDSEPGVVYFTEAQTTKQVAVFPRSITHIAQPLR
jgi:hypothetical protein